MTNSTDMTEEQELAQSHPPAWSTVFGDEDLSAYAPQDQPASPGPRSTATLHANRVRQGEQAARQDRDLAAIAASDRERAEDEALIEAQGLNRAGRAVPAGVRSMAMRALERRGVRVPTSTTLAGPTLARLRREAQDRDDSDQAQRRRAGRRPRS
jgi:hypothetical protein